MAKVLMCSCSKCQDTLVASLGADEMRAMHLTDVPWPPWPGLDVAV